MSDLDHSYKRADFVDEQIDKKVAHAIRVIRLYDETSNRLN